MSTAREILRRLAAEYQQAGEATVAKLIEAEANGLGRLDSADSIDTKRHALTRLVGCASRHALEAEERQDANDARRARAVSDGAEMELAELRALETGVSVKPPGWMLTQARQAHRWRTDIDDATRREAEQQTATRMAQTLADNERKLAAGPAHQLVQRADTGKADVARDKLGVAARAAKDALDLFTAVGDTGDATRLRAIVTELEALAKNSRADSRGMRSLPNASKLDGCELPRGRRPLPNALKKDPQ